MEENRTPPEIWDDIMASTDLPEPGLVSDMAGLVGDAEAEPLPDGDAEDERDFS